MVKPLLAAACLAALTLSACEPSTECADPTLLTTARTQLSSGEETLVYLWGADGQRDRLDTGPLDRGRAVLSPDGDLVAFAQPVGEFDPEYGWPGSRLAVLSRQTGEVTPLTDAVEGISVSQLQWSGDGSRIAFERFTGWQAGDRKAEIAVVGVDGTDERTVLELDIRQEVGFALSSDGEELLVPTPPEEVAGPGEVAEKTELWRYSVDTGEHEVVETPHERVYAPVWSPDGRLVAMSATTLEPGSSGTDRLYVFDMESGTSTPVDRRRGGATGVTWSGPYLLYVYNVRGTGDVFDNQFMRWDSRTQEREQVARPGLSDEENTFTSISAPRCS